MGLLDRIELDGAVGDAAKMDPPEVSFS